MTEQWRIIPFEELMYYEASSDGNIRDANKKLRNQWLCHGYKYVTLKRKDGLYWPYRVNRLVAAAFLGNQENLVVDHRDGNRINNNIENLAWCTQKENCNTEIHRKRLSAAARKVKRNRKKIYKLNDKGDIIDVYESARQAARENNIFVQNISACCLGKISRCAGFIWRYAVGKLNVPKEVEV